MAKEDSKKTINLPNKWPSIEIKEKLKYIGQFTLLVVIYGAIISFATSQLLGFTFTFGRALGFGIMAYILKYELPIIIKSSIK